MSRQPFTGKLVGVLGGVLGSVLLTGAVVWLSTRAGSTSPEGAALPSPLEQTTGTSHAATATSSAAPSPISEKSVRRLARDGTILDTPATGAVPEVTIDVAMKSAHREFPGILYGEEVPTESGLVSATIRDHGPDSGHCLCWAFIYSGVPIPIMGGLPPDQGGASLPAHYLSDFLVLMDAKTGKFITAETLA